MPTEDVIPRLRLIRSEGVGPVTYRRLLARYRTPEAALDALPGLSHAGGRTTSSTVPSIHEVVREIEQVERLGGQLIFLGDPDYPPLLAQLDDAPPVIAVLGDAALLALPAVAIVGGRNASAAGLRMAEILAERPRLPGHHRFRARARHRRDRPHRGDANRPHGRRDRQRAGRRLPGREHQSPAPDRRARRGDHRSTARHSTAGAPLSAPQPPDRGPVIWASWWWRRRGGPAA